MCTMCGWVADKYAISYRCIDMHGMYRGSVPYGADTGVYADHRKRSVYIVISVPAHHPGMSVCGM